MAQINFTKMHGTGNDFVVIDCLSQAINNRQELARTMCARKFGIGADQLILICSSETGDYSMEIYNPDGSHVEMCGNALRAVALYAKKYMGDKKKSIQIETLGGTTHASVKNKLVTVNVGPPSFNPEDIGLNHTSSLIGQKYSFSKTIERKVTCVSMGNPHCIQIVKDTANCLLETEGPIIEHHTLFKNRTNVEFIEIISSSEVNMRVWERGTGETLACGSGACAAAAALIQNGLTERSIRVNLKGGVLNIEWRKDDNCIYMTGPATFVYDGVWQS